ncbi:MAG: formylglycine-generating enzyme family protein [Planctomycetaceae bacterium]|nr:formylglycine-generating enzyme family protein [Planctomycetaceae bacterium]
MRLIGLFLIMCICCPCIVAQVVPESGTARRDNALRMPLVYCESGSFFREWAGKHPEKPGLGPFREKVTLTTGFWIGQYEVTQAEWQAVMGNRIWEIKNAKKSDRERDDVPDGSRFPASLMSWEEATEFCQRLTQTEKEAGRLPADEVYRLPTEAEWEWACRAGSSKGLYCCGDSVEELRKYAWFSPSPRGLIGQMHEVGLKLPNRWGLYDMHGNIAELCLDAFLPWSAYGTDPIYRSGSYVRDLHLHVVKGGSYHSIPVGCESSLHFDNGTGRPRGEQAWIGFRVARGLDPNGAPVAPQVQKSVRIATTEELFRQLAKAIDSEQFDSIQDLFFPDQPAVKLGLMTAAEAAEMSRLQAQSFGRLATFRKLLAEEGLLPLEKTRLSVKSKEERIVKGQRVELAALLASKANSVQVMQIIDSAIRLDGQWYIVELFDEPMIEYLKAIE